MTIQDFKTRAKKYKNTLVLDYSKVVRLEGFTHDCEDFYWIYDTGRGIVHSSCVGDFIALKDYLQEKDYKELVRVWNLNTKARAK